MIYLDNAATSWPKPPEVAKKMVQVLEQAGGNPGRSGHSLSIKAARVVYETSEALATFLNLSDPLRIIFTNNATHALNIVVQGLLEPGNTVVTSSMEHNSLMRPLRNLEKRGVRLKIVQCLPDGRIMPDDVAKAIDNKTRLVAMLHASNVTGTIMPISEISEIAHKVGALVLVDAAQTAGVRQLDIEALGADFLAITGHKGLLGPPGIGALLINSNFDTSNLRTLMQGGTGSQSEREEQPEYLPDKYESGTVNLVGIAGLLAGIKWIEKKGLNEIREHESKLRSRLVCGLSTIKGVKIYGPEEIDANAAIVSFTIAGKTVSEIGQRLDDEFGILTRVGLHCAPAAHHTIGSFPGGTVRLAPGIFTTMDDMQYTLSAIDKIAKQ